MGGVRGCGCGQEEGLGRHVLNYRCVLNQECTLCQFTELDTKITLRQIYKGGGGPCMVYLRCHGVAPAALRELCCQGQTSASVGREICMQYIMYIPTPKPFHKATLRYVCYLSLLYVHVT